MKDSHQGKTFKTSVALTKTVGYSGGAQHQKAQIMSAIVGMARILVKSLGKALCFAFCSPFWAHRTSSQVPPA
jgi:hypothetical protein